MSSLLESMMAFLNNFGSKDEREYELDHGRWFYNEISNKLPFEYNASFREKMKDRGMPSNARTLLAHLDRHVESMNEARQNRKKSLGYQARITTKAERDIEEEQESEAEFSDEQDQVHYGLNPDKPPFKKQCDACEQGDHWFKECPVFIRWTPQERREHIVKKKRCYGCLRVDHPIRECPKKLTCEKCNRRHHTLLHGSKPIHQRYEANFIQAQNEANDTTDAEESEDDASRAYVISEKKPLPDRPIKALRVVKIRLTNGNKSEDICALLDDGTNLSLLSSEIASKLDLEGCQTDLHLNVAGGKKVELQSLYSKVQIRSLMSNFEIQHSIHVVEDPVGNLRPVNWNKHKKNWPHLKNLRFTPINPSDKVHMIIGVDAPTLLCSLKELTAGQKDPVARLTNLGWTATGLTRPLQEGETEAEPTATLSYVFMTRPITSSEFCAKYSAKELLYSKTIKDIETSELEETSFRQIQELFDKQYDVELSMYDDTICKTPEENRSMQILRDTRTLDENHKVTLGVLWKEGEPDLPNNYEGAKHRLDGMLKSKRMTKENLERYQQAINKWLESGYVRIVKQTEERPEIAYYLPHFGVVRSNRKTTKLRIVMDAKSKFFGKSLNDAIMAGPNLINDLPLVLTRFRRKPIAFGADIKEMFLQCKMSKEDRKYHRFLWKMNGEGPIVEFEFISHVFGNRGSPSVAIFSIKESAREFVDKCPEAAESVLQSSIVDDILDSTDNIEQAKQNIEHLKLIFENNGMKVTKWLSNDASVLADVPREEWAPDLQLGITSEYEHTPIFKTLGMVWNAETDMFSFYQEIPEFSPWTKRKCLSAAARIYDPLGLITPFILRARLFIQTLWEFEQGWDENLPETMTKSWIEWFHELKDLPKIQIQRCLKTKESNKEKSQELHFFSDASSKAMGTAVYLVTRYENQMATCHLVAARSHVKRKGLSIPRMELQAAVMSSEMKLKIANLFPEATTTFWTDSSNVLYWLQQRKPLQLFVNNRVLKILRLTNANDWKHVPGDENPADLSSRGCTILDLVDNELWWNGPKFLVSQEWPISPLVEETSENLKEEKAFKPIAMMMNQTDTTCLIDVERFSKLSRLIGTMKIVLKATNKMRKQPDDQLNEKAMQLLIRNHQATKMTDLLKNIKKGLQTTEKVKILQTTTLLG